MVATVEKINLNSELFSKNCNKDGAELSLELDNEVARQLVLNLGFPDCTGSYNWVSLKIGCGGAPLHSACAQASLHTNQPTNQPTYQTTNTPTQHSVQCKINNVIIGHNIVGPYI